MAKVLVPKIEHVTYIDVPVEQVYETLTTSDGWDSWFTDEATLDAVPAGQVRFDGSTSVLCERPPKMEVVCWRSRRTGSLSSSGNRARP